MDGGVVEGLSVCRLFAAAAETVTTAVCRGIVRQVLVPTLRGCASRRRYAAMRNKILSGSYSLKAV